MSLDGVGVFVKAEDGIRCGHVTGVQTSALPILHQAPGGAGHTGTRFENDGGRTRPTNPIVQSAAVVQGRVPCRTVGVAGLIVIAQYEALYIRVIRLVCPSCWAAQAWWARCRTYRRRTWPTRSPDPRPPWLRYH